MRRCGDGRHPRSAVLGGTLVPGLARNHRAAARIHPARAWWRVHPLRHGGLRAGRRRRDHRGGLLPAARAGRARPGGLSAGRGPQHHRQKEGRSRDRAQERGTGNAAGAHPPARPAQERLLRQRQPRAAHPAGVDPGAGREPVGLDHQLVGDATAATGGHPAQRLLAAQACERPAGPGQARCAAHGATPYPPRHGGTGARPGRAVPRRGAAARTELRDRHAAILAGLPRPG